MLLTIMKYLVIFDIIAGFISTYYYVIRPNRINKRNYKKVLKTTEIELKALNTNIKTTEGLIEAQELASINPAAEFNKVKMNNYESLMEVITYTKKQVIPNMDGSLTGMYIDIIAKAEKLLELGKEDGKIITEISKIYNIYMNDVNNILLKKSGNKDDIIKLLNNFSSYIDRKLDKYNSIDKLLMDSELNALNKIFTGEEE